MDKRRLCLVLLFCTLPVAAHADRHKKGFRVAGAKTERSNLKGWQFSTEFPLARKEAKAGCCCCTQASPDGTQDGAAPTPEERTLSAVLEGGIVAGEHEGEDLVQITYLSGLRYSFNRPFQKRVQVFVQALVGGSHDSRGKVHDQPLATGGVGLHVPVRDWWGISVEVDRCVLMAGAKEWYTEISVGLVWRLEK